jgi:hypothetical protein
MTTGDKPLSEYYFKGFSYTAKATWIKKVADILKKHPNEEIAQAAVMGSPAFGLSSNSSIDLDYDDLDELKEHPVLGQFVGLTFKQL